MQQVNLFLELLILLLGDIKKEKIMAFDPTLPATGVNKFGDLYAVLRANFTEVEAWTNIGSGGSTWGTDWVNANAEYPAGFMKDPFGFVHLRGMAHNDGNTNYPITLPSGFFPEQHVTFLACYGSGSVYLFAIHTDGTTFCGAGFGAYIYLDGITFKAA